MNLFSKVFKWDSGGTVESWNHNDSLLMKTRQIQNDRRSPCDHHLQFWILITSRFIFAVYKQLFLYVSVIAVKQLCYNAYLWNMGETGNRQRGAR